MTVGFKVKILRVPTLGRLILVQPELTELGGTHVRLFSSYSVHTVPGTVSQIDCNIVSVTVQIRYVLITSHPSTLASNSLHTGSLDELRLGI